MLTRKQRFQCWAALSGFALFFYSCYRLIDYRLRSDDLELMEREVYEELKLKKEVARFINQSKMEGKQIDPREFIR